MKYVFAANAPRPIDENEYKKKATNELISILDKQASDEDAFQQFFEKNPSFVPGSRSEFDSLGASGHGPYRDVLITQPKIRGVINRMPDFMWLSKDSVVFTPIFIEIEAPSKKYFNRDGTPTQNFVKARNQLAEWRTIMSNPINILSFYEDFDISNDLRDLIFEPYYVLIYGRREEYSGNKLLTQKRYTLVDRGKNEVVMSYDRLSPTYAHNNYITCTVKDGNYIAKVLSPGFTLGPFSSNILSVRISNQAILNMNFTSDERKRFLIDRISYWQNILKKRGDEDAVISFSFADLFQQHEE